jgi:hypothetical protein
VSRCQGAKIKNKEFYLSGAKVPKGAKVKVSRSRLELNFCLFGVKVPGSLGSKVSRYRAVPRFQRCQDAKVMRCQGFQIFRVSTLSKC